MQHDGGKAGGLKGILKKEMQARGAGWILLVLIQAQVKLSLDVKALLMVSGVVSPLWF